MIRVRIGDAKFKIDLDGIKEIERLEEMLGKLDKVAMDQITPPHDGIVLRWEMGRLGNEKAHRMAAWVLPDTLRNHLMTAASLAAPAYLLYHEPHLASLVLAIPLALLAQGCVYAVYGLARLPLVISAALLLAVAHAYCGVWDRLDNLLEDPVPRKWERLAERLDARSGQSDWNGDWNQ